MYLSDFISRHLKADLPISDCDCVCKMCGKAIKQGIGQKDIIKKATFTDYQYLRHNSAYLCVECSKLIGVIEVNEKKTWLRNFSFICDKDKLTILKREKIWEHLFDPPESPFVFCVTYSNKKHIAFKSEIQYSRESYKIFTDKGAALIEPEKLREIAAIIQSWHMILPGKEETKQQSTWFTKTEILTGGRNYKNIRLYGLDRYLRENAALDIYRNTALLKLLVFAVNKRIDSL